MSFFFDVLTKTSLSIQIIQAESLLRAKVSAALDTVGSLLSRKCVHLSVRVARLSIGYTNNDKQDEMGRRSKTRRTMKLEELEAREEADSQRKDRRKTGWLEFYERANERNFALFRMWIAMTTRR